VHAWVPISEWVLKEDVMAYCRMQTGGYNDEVSVNTHILCGECMNRQSYNSLH